LVAVNGTTMYSLMFFLFSMLYGISYGAGLIFLLRRPINIEYIVKSSVNVQRCVFNKQFAVC